MRGLADRGSKLSALFRLLCSLSAFFPARVVRCERAWGRWCNVEVESRVLFVWSPLFCAAARPPGQVRYVGGLEAGGERERWRVLLYLSVWSAYCTVLYVSTYIHACNGMEKAEPKDRVEADRGCSSSSRSLHLCMHTYLHACMRVTVGLVCLLLLARLCRRGRVWVSWDGWDGRMACCCCCCCCSSESSMGVSRRV